MPITVTVDRNSADDAQQREIKVVLDGEQIAELLYGQTVSKEVPAGAHTLLVDNTWSKQALQFMAGENEQVHFLAKNHASSFSQFLLGIFGAGPLKVFLTRQ